MKNKKQKEITNLELLDSINRSFSRMEDKMATKEDLRDLETRMNGKFEGINNRIDDLSENRVKYEDHNKLKARVSFIEKKLEIK